MDFLRDEMTRQQLFNFVFIGGLAILLQVLILKLKHPAIMSGSDGKESLFSIVSVTTSSSGNTCNENETASAVASSVALLALLVCSIIAFSYFTQHVSGEQIGLGLVFTQAYLLATFILKRVEIVNKYAFNVSAILFGITLAYIWYASDNWIVDDLCAIMICLVTAKGIINPIPIKALIMGSLAIITYDFWGVWGAETVGGGVIATSMETLSETHLPPLAIISPGLPLEVLSGTSAILGLGDVIFPAFVICTAAQYGLHRMVLGSYLVGLLVVMIISATFETGVPAMVPILPIMITILLVAAKAKGVQIVKKQVDTSELKIISVR